MFVSCVVVTVALAAMASSSGVMKLTGHPKIVDGITGLGVPLGWFPFLAGVEIAGTVGVLIGLAWAPLGLVAGAGLVSYFAGAVITHFRAGDLQGLVKPLPLLALAILGVVLRAVTL